MQCASDANASDITGHKLIGDICKFAIEYTFIPDTHETELAIYVDGSNILAWVRDGESFTTRWNIDELVLWLRNFINDMRDDPFPVDCEGQYAARKDDAARDFDCEDEDAFEAYYEKLYEWNLRHRWHTASAGAVLADVFFQLVGDYVEISWDNRSVEADVSFLNLSGGTKIPKQDFIATVNQFLMEYAVFWY